MYTQAQTQAYIHAQIYNHTYTNIQASQAYTFDIQHLQLIHSKMNWLFY